MIPERLQGKIRKSAKHSPHDESSTLFGELINVFLGSFVASVKSSFKQMGKLIEFSEFPLRIRRILSASN